MDIPKIVDTFAVRYISLRKNASTGAFTEYKPIIRITEPTSLNNIMKNHKKLTARHSCHMHTCIATLSLAMAFTACQNKTTNNDSATDSLAAITEYSDNTAEIQASNKPDTMELRKFVTLMYEDILKQYTTDKEYDAEPEEKYMSETYKKLIEEVDKVEEETGTHIYGWQCSPWILAQDANNPVATVLKVFMESAEKGKVDVLIHDGKELDDRKVRVYLTKETGEWKVYDFIGTESADYAPTYCERLKEEIEEARQNKNNAQHYI